MLEEATRNANNLTGLVKRKKDTGSARNTPSRATPPVATGKRKLDASGETEEESRGDKKARVEDET